MDTNPFFGRFNLRSEETVGLAEGLGRRIVGIVGLCGLVGLLGEVVAPTAWFVGVGVVRR